MKNSPGTTSLLVSSAVLGGGLLIAKIIGAMYRIPLASVLGGEGLGIYQMVFPLYSLLLTLSSSAIPASLAKVISEYLSSGRGEDAVMIYRVARRFIVAVSVLCSVGLFLFGDEVAILQGERLGGLSYVAISPAILIVGFVSCFRGKFQGMNNMLPTAVSQICEQVGKLIFSIALPIYFGGSIGEKVALAVFGVTISEVFGLCSLLVFSVINKRKKHLVGSFGSVWKNGELALSQKRKSGFSAGDIRAGVRLKTLSPLFKIALPMTISFSIFPIAGIIESGLIINFLNLAGESGVSQFGIYSGGVVTMMSLPLGVCSALGTALIPSISADMARGEKVVARRKISLAIKAGMVVSLGVGVMFLLFSHQIVALLFARLAGTAGGLLEKMLKWSFLSVVLSCFSNVTSAILYALSQGGTPLKSQLLGLCLRFGVMTALLPSMGIYASLVGMFAGGVLSGVINFAGINKTLETPLSLRPLISGGLCTLLLGLGLYLISVGFVMSFARVAMLCLTYLCFLFLLYFLGFFSQEEIRCLVGKPQ